jgi:hypothetical protein
METRLPQLSRAFILLLSVFALVAMLAPSARAAQPGVVSDLTWYISDSDKARTASALEDLGSDWTRLAIQWREAEPQEGQYNEWWLNEYEKAINMAHAAGQRVIVMVDEAPSWASGSSSSNAPGDPAKFARFMSVVAKRYAGKVDGWEIWNEENLQRFWTSGPNPSAYAALLRAAYPAVKSADPAAKVVFGGTAGNDYAFLEGVYAAGGKGYFDVLGTHPYPYCGSTNPEEIRMSGSRISKDSFLGYREMRRTMQANGDEKPIWITEMGWTTSSGACSPGGNMWQGGVSETRQAEYLYKAYKLLEADPYVEVALWYNIRNNYWLHDEDQAEARFGLMSTNFSPKAAYGAFKAYAHGEPYALAPTPPAPTKGKKKTRTVLRLATKQAFVPTSAEGTVARADQGTVLVVIQVRKKDHWRTIRRRSAKVSARGRYRTRLRHLPHGNEIRARAIFRGSHDTRPSRSHYIRAGANDQLKQRRD